MFLDFFYLLREHRLPVGTNEWLAFMDALSQGLEGGRLDGFYHLGRALLVKSEAHYDAYDVAFAKYFKDFGISAELTEALKRWLENPERAQSDAVPRVLELEALQEEFRKLLQEQKEKHEGGNRFIGTRGASPFGREGQNPQGMRVGEGGMRTAVLEAEARQFQNYRSDVQLDTRHFKVALKGLRRLEREGPDVLQLERTVRATSDNGGEIELIFGPDRRNNFKLLLLMDAGGSMDPHTEVVSRLFSAAHAAHHLKRFEFYYFHNCVYSRIYKDIAHRDAVPTMNVLRDLGSDFRVVFVGDACMATWELNAGNDFSRPMGATHMTGLDWLKAIRKHFRDAVWLNPEARRFWNHPTISAIGAQIPMYELTLDGLAEAVRRLRIGRRDLR